MKVLIEVFGPLRNCACLKAKNGSFALSLENPIPLHYLVNQRLRLRDIDKIVLVNGKYVAPNYCLREGDTVQIFSPLPGG
jgi:molybdopterin converting factor small subunit